MIFPDGTVKEGMFDNNIFVNNNNPTQVSSNSA
jgi:hypothetical protein